MFKEIGPAPVRKQITSGPEVIDSEVLVVKVLEAAAQDKSIYLAQAEISPLGTVIGKVLVGVSTANVDDSLEALDQRFASLIEGSGELVSSGLSGAAADSAATLAARLQAARDTAVNMTEGSRQTVQEAAAALRWRVAAGLLLVGGLLLFSVLIVLGWRPVARHWLGWAKRRRCKVS